MENRKSLKTILLIAIGIVSMPILVSAYADSTTHPAVTDEAIDLFNQHYSNLKISEEEKVSIKKGSVDEDIAPRWMQHFYDPVYNKGLAGFQSSKQYAETLPIVFGFSASVFDDPRSYSWDRAVYDYVYRDKKRGLEALGHVLHLVEDSAVPDHTRNDGHPPVFNQGSDYEGFAYQFNDKNFSVSNIGSPIIFSSLGQYFDSLANYSNNNFFSKDTILNKYYTDPKITSIKEEKLSDRKIYTIGFNKNGSRLVKIETFRNLKTGEKESIYSLNVPDNKIFTDYWNNLSKQAVLHSAGVIKLFFDEVAKEKQTLALYNKGLTPKDKLANYLASIFFSSKTNTPKTIPPPTPNQNQPSQNNLPPTTPEPEPLIQTQEEWTPTPPLTSSEPENFDAGEWQPTYSLISFLPVQQPLQNNFIALAQNFTGSLTSAGFGGGMPNPPQNNSQETNSEPNTDDETNSDNETGTSTPEIIIPVDTTPPIVSLAVTECSSSLSPTSCLTATTTLNIFWESLDEDLNYFEITQNGTISTTTATSTIFISTDNTKNIFSVRAVDQNNNWSESQTKEVVISTSPVVINEVAWAGTSSETTGDEWIELYNKSEKEISLNGWTLFSETDFGPYINLSGIIPAKGFYLIERTDDNAISNVPANLVSSFGNGLANGGEVLNLSLASTTIDRTILCSSGPNKWCPGFDYKYRTMERKDPNIAGNIPSNWRVSSDFITFALNSKGRSAKGTPGARNSAHYLIADNASVVKKDVTLIKENSPYILDDMNQTFTDGAVLTIEPGVVIKSNNTSALIFQNGAKLIAKGTASDPIVFTSASDKEYGMDANTASSTGLVGGTWFGVRIETDGSEIDHSIFRYGGMWYSGDSWYSRANLYIVNASAKISNSTFEYSRAYGLKLTNSNSEIENCIIRENNKSFDTAGIGASLYVGGGAPKIKNSTISKNKVGLYISGSSAEIENNNFELNSGEAIRSFGPPAIFKENKATGNLYNTISLYGDVTKINSISILNSNPIPYYLSGSIKVVASSTLEIEPGTIIKSSNMVSISKLNVYGKLIAKGAVPSDIIFTHLFDDNFGGQSFVHSTSTIPGKKSWEGISLYAGAEAEIKGATLIYADTALKCTSANLNISDSKISTNEIGIKLIGTCNANIATSTVEFLNNTQNTNPPL